MKCCNGVELAFVAVMGLWSVGAQAQDELEPQQAAQRLAANEELAVAVLGLRALGGDDEVTHELTGWLRAGTSAVEGWRLHTAIISLEQLMLVHDCESSSEDCISRIAATLEADRVISGSLSRTEAKGPESQHDFQVRLFLFNAETGRFEKASTVQIHQEKATPEELAVLAQQEVARFAESPFDELGQEQAIELRLSRDGVQSAQQSSPGADMQDVFPAWPAAASYTGAAVFLGLAAWSWTTIKNVEQDPSFQRARELAGPQESDVCSGDTNFGVEGLDGLCSKANTHETLQWVFLGMGLASAGVGTWLLVKSIKSKRSAERPQMELAPVAGKKLGGVSARFEF
jgi:hypothetical protein